MKPEIIKHQFEDILIVELDVHRSDIEEQDSLAYLGADSLDIMDIIYRVEDKFGIEISDCEKASLRTVKDYLDLINKKTADRE